MAAGLKKVLYFLGTLDDQDIEWMVRNGAKRSVPARTQIINEGKPSDDLFFILSGEFSVTAARSRGEIARLTAGEILGEISFVDSRPPSATVTSLTDAVVGAVSIGALEQRLLKDVAFAARFYKAIAIALADRVRSTAGAGPKAASAGGSIEDDAEVAPHLLDTLSMAGVRFADMQRRPWGSTGA
jgi:CRP/FNR family cyclic AMP-dependent transcriptional regulator